MTEEPWLMPTHPNHHEITYSFFYHDTQSPPGVVAGMTHALRVQGRVIMHVLMNATTLLHVMGWDGPHTMKARITEFLVP